MDKKNKEKECVNIRFIQIINFLVLAIIVYVVGYFATETIAKLPPLVIIIIANLLAAITGAVSSVLTPTNIMIDGVARKIFEAIVKKISVSAFVLIFFGLGFTGFYLLGTVYSQLFPYGDWRRLGIFVNYAILLAIGRWLANKYLVIISRTEKNKE